MDPVRAAVVSDDPLARGGMAALLGGRADVVLAASTASADAQSTAAASGTDVALWDATTGEPDALRALAAALPVVALAATEAEASRALAAGARAVVFRDAAGDRLAAALIAAARGLFALDPSLARWLHLPAAAAEGGGGEALTPREAEVLALLAEGLPNKGIARRLGVSERTAKFHVESILAKLGAESRSEAIVLAARRGLVTL